MHTTTRRIIWFALAAGVAASVATYATDDPRPLAAQELEAFKAGKFERALRLVNRQLEAEPGNADFWYELGRVRRALGRTDQLSECWVKAATLQAQRVASDRRYRRNQIELYNLACYQALAGNCDGALEALERSVRAGWQDIALARVDPDLDSLRDEPRYVEALLQMEVNRNAPPDNTGSERGDGRPRRGSLLQAN